MSIYVACQCGQAFHAESHLAGQTLACPACGRPLAVPYPPGPPQPFGPPTGFAGGYAPQPQPSYPYHPQPSPAAGFGGPLQTPARQEEEPRWLIGLAIGGGGAVLLVLVGFLIYNATQKPAAATASTPAQPPPEQTAPVTTTSAPQAMTPSPAPMPMATPMPMTPSPAPLPVPVTTSTPATIAPANASDLPATGGGIKFTTATGEFEFTMPKQPDGLGDTYFEGMPRHLSTEVLGGEDVGLKVEEWRHPGPVTAAIVEEQAKLSRSSSNFSETPIKFAGRDALEHKHTYGRDPARQYFKRTILFASGNGLFVVECGGRETQRDSPREKAFLDSFRPVERKPSVLSANGNQYEIQMPSAVTTTKEPANQLWQSKTESVCKTESGEYKFAEIQYLNVPDPQVVERAADDFANRVRSLGEVKRNKVSVAGGTAFEMVWQSPDAWHKTWLFTVGKTRMILEFKRHATQADSSEDDAFFESFRKKTNAASAPPPAAGNSVPGPVPAGTTVVSKTGNYELWWPGEPQKSVNSDAVVTAELMKYETPSPTRSFVFNEAKFAQARSLDEWEKHMLEAPASVWLPFGKKYKQQRITFAGFPATEMTLAPAGPDNYSAKAVLFVANGAVISLTVAGPNDGAASPEAKKFLESFRKKN